MTPTRKPYWSTTKLRVICIVMWVAIFAATLWPFNPYPRNDVRWLAEANGVHLGKNGIVLSSGAFAGDLANDARGCSLEIWLRADNDSDVHTFLTFYAPGDLLPLELRQYGQVALIERRNRDPRGRIARAEIDVEHVFHHASPTLLSITSGARGTKVYLNGQLAQSVAGYHFSAANLSGELLLGAAPVTYDTWSGELRGLAFYGNELSAQQVQQHFSQWTQSGTLAADPAENALAQYFFAERSGTLVHNQVAGAPDLLIPEHFQVPHKAMLTPPWKEVTPLWIYIDDLARNIAGFVPLGMVFYLYLLRVHARKRAILQTILLGGLTSLGIEVLQTFIPQRVSGVTDIITNTSGTALGVLLLQPKPIRVMLETLGILEVAQGSHD